MILKIKCLGYSCFQVETYDGVSVLVDPYNDITGYTLPKDLTADIVLISHPHPAHSCIEAVNGNPAIYQGPGLREAGWVKVRGISSFHDEEEGRKLGPNTIFCWDMRAVKLCHLGDLGYLPDENLLREIGPVDVLFIPIGTLTTLSLEAVDELIEKIECKYIIPMKYKTRYNHKQLVALDEFLKDRKNVIVPDPKNEFIIDRERLSVKEKTIVAMEYVE